MIIKIKKGFDIPISGEIKDFTLVKKNSKKAAVYGPDFVGMKPSMLVQLGDSVKVGTPLFKCKKNEGIVYTAPVSGVVKEINRGHRRTFISVVIENDGQDLHHSLHDSLSKDLSMLTRQEIVDILVSCGEWVGLRTRPYSKVPAIESKPNSIFVTATDSNPLAMDPAFVVGHHGEDFEKGLEVLTKLTDGKVHLCASAPVVTNVREGIEMHQVQGPHPAGNVGTHIHFIDPVCEGKEVWHIGYQNLIAIGRLFSKGEIWNQRYIALVGPEVVTPQVILTNRGADLEDLCQGELKAGADKRIISGSVLSGHVACGASAYLGRYHNQVSVIAEGAKRELFGWAMPGLNKLSVGGTFLSTVFGRKKFSLNSCLNGGRRAIVPTGVFEKVLPLNLLATPLLISLASGDVEQAQRLGCMELDEEDLALCTFSCNGKNDYGVFLRDSLTMIEREG